VRALPGGRSPLPTRKVCRAGTRADLECSVRDWEPARFSAQCARANAGHSRMNTRASPLSASLARHPRTSRSSTRTCIHPARFACPYWMLIKVRAGAQALAPARIMMKSLVLLLPLLRCRMEACSDHQAALARNPDTAERPKSFRSRSGGAVPDLYHESVIVRTARQGAVPPLRQQLIVATRLRSCIREASAFAMSTSLRRACEVAMV
jgi:hypothetical protein